MIFGKDNFIWLEQDCLYFGGWKKGKATAQCTGEQQKRIQSAELIPATNKLVFIMEEGEVEDWDTAKKSPLKLKSLPALKQACRQI